MVNKLKNVNFMSGTQFDTVEEVSQDELYAVNIENDESFRNLILNITGLSSTTDYVVKSYKNGTDWYRVYKSGWVEQGGKAKATGSTTTLILLRPFADTNYWCMSNMISSDTGNAHTNYMYVEPVSTTAMKFGAYQSGSTVRWYACGQGA